jgi:dCMP deaminase
MSKDPSTRVGAVIVGPDREVRSVGFNGFPRGIEDTTARLSDSDLKNRLVVHGEMNAVLAAARVGIPLKGCTIYLAAMNAVTGKLWGGPPCVRCTVELIQAGITGVVTWPFKDVPSKWKEDIEFARTLLQEAGVSYREVTQL